MSSKLKSNISWLALVKLFNVTLPLVTLPHLTNVLGIELFGVIAIGFAIQQVVFAFTDYGFGIMAPKLVAQQRQNLGFINQLITSISIIKCVLFMVLAFTCSLIFYLFEIKDANRDIWLLMLLPTLMQCLIPLWLFLGIEKMEKVAIINLTERVIYTALIFVLISSADDAILVGAIMCLSMFTALTASTFLAYKEGFLFSKVKLSDLTLLVKDGWGYFYSRITLLLFSKFNVIIVGAVLGEASAGVFSLAERIYNAGRSLCSPLTDALYPYMVRTQNWSLGFKITRYSVLVGLATIAIAWLFADWFFVVVFSEAFIESAHLFKLLMFAFSASLVSMLIGYPILGAMNLSHHVNRSVVIGALVHISAVLLLWYLDNLTAQWLVISLITTEVVILLYRLINLHKNKHQLKNKTSVEGTSPC